ncbi:MAG: HesA/MoeB/ThiF family protein [Chloroflexota bacterium]|nr:HesA/MoeB/ThiF family protein [Chloroflexota bacterium]
MLATEELARYDRQIRLEGFGAESQEKLKRARVLVAGVGGLGCPVAMYLAAAGIGHLRLVDEDVVDQSNLNRQVLHWQKDVGREKVLSAAEKLRLLNPHITVEPIVQTISAENVLELADGCDLIMDCMDNYPTRYVLNEAALKKRIPFVHGAIYGLQGELTTVLPGVTPCLRCIFRGAPPKETFPVLGVTPGVIACLQAMEAIKYLTGVGELMAGRLLLFDGNDMQFSEVRIKRNPHCQDCARLPGQARVA